MSSARAVLSLAGSVGLLCLVAAWLLRVPEPPPPPRPAEPAPAPPPASLPLRFAPAPAGVAAPGPATFEGRVLSAATGAPVPGAELTFSRGGAADTVRAGEDGGFLFRPVVAGRWLLAAVAAQGFFPFAPEWGYSPIQLEAQPGRRVRGLEVFLTPAAELAGLVVDEDGIPAPGAEIRLLGAGGRAALIPIPDRFVADAAGAFRAAAPEGSVLEARKPGYYPGHARVDLPAVVNGRIRITLGAAWSGPAPARGALAGRVTARDGRPLPGALVEAGKTHGWAYWGTPVAQAVTDADGRFRIGDLDRSPHQVTVRAEGCAPGVVRRVLPGGPEVEVALLPGGRLRGCVRDEAGAPVAPFSLQIFFSRYQYSDADLTVSVADPSGCFALEELEPGPAIAVAHAPGRASSAPVRVEVPAPPLDAEVLLRMPRGGSVRGLVRDERSGAPLPGARVRAEALLLGADLGGAPMTLAEAVAGDDGTFTLGGLTELVRVHAEAAGHHPGATGGVAVPPGGEAAPVELSLRPQLPGDSGPVELAGVGAALAQEGEAVRVGALRPGADAGGLLPGDELLEIDGHPVADLGPGGAVEALRGPAGTTAFLTVKRGDAVVEVEAARMRFAP